MTKREAYQREAYQAGREMTVADYVIRDGARAHKGYLILRNPITGDVWVTKGGVTVAYPPDVDSAVKTVEELTAGG